MTVGNDPPRRKARWDDEGEGDNAVVRGKLNTTSLAAMKLADARRGQVAPSPMSRNEYEQ